MILGHSAAIEVGDLAPITATTEEKTSSEKLSYHEAIDGHRRSVIIEALTKTQGNRAAAARLLGLERSYLLKLMKTFQIN